MSERSKGVAERIRGPVVTLGICLNEDGSVHFGSVVKYMRFLVAAMVLLIPAVVIAACGGGFESC